MNNINIVWNWIQLFPNLFIYNNFNHRNCDTSTSKQFNLYFPWYCKVYIACVWEIVFTRFTTKMSNGFDTKFKRISAQLYLVSLSKGFNQWIINSIIYCFIINLICIIHLQICICYYILHILFSIISPL